MQLIRFSNKLFTFILKSFNNFTFVFSLNKYPILSYFIVYLYLKLKTASL